MMVLVTGGASSGKSACAENVALELPGPRFYLAAMKPYGTEAARRIERHRKLRAGKGFETIECHDGLKRAVSSAQAEVAKACGAGGAAGADATAGTDDAVSTGGAAGASATAGTADAAGAAGTGTTATPDGTGATGGTALLECLGNVVANELFADDGSSLGEDAALSAVLDGIEALAETFGNLVVVGNEVGSDGISYGDDTQTYMRVLGSAACALAQRCDIVIECIAGQPMFVKGSACQAGACRTPGRI